MDVGFEISDEMWPRVLSACERPVSFRSPRRNALFSMVFNGVLVKGTAFAIRLTQDLRRAPRLLGPAPAATYGNRRSSDRLVTFLFQTVAKHRGSRVNGGLVCTFMASSTPLEARPRKSTARWQRVKEKNLGDNKLCRVTRHRVSFDFPRISRKISGPSWD